MSVSTPIENMSLNALNMNELNKVKKPKSEKLDVENEKEDTIVTVQLLDDEEGGSEPVSISDGYSFNNGESIIHKVKNRK